LRRCRSYSLQELDVSLLVSDGKFDCSGEASWVDLLDPMVIRGSNCRSSFIPVAKQMTRWVELNPPHHYWGGIGYVLYAIEYIQRNPIISKSICSSKINVNKRYSSNWFRR